MDTAEIRKTASLCKSEFVNKALVGKHSLDRSSYYPENKTAHRLCRSGSPLVTLWPLLNQVHLTVSPTEIFRCGRLEREPPSAPTATSKIGLLPDGTPLTAGWPF